MGDKRSDILFQGRSYFLSDRFFDAPNWKILQHFFFLYLKVPEPQEEGDADQYLDLNLILSSIKLM